MPISNKSPSSEEEFLRYHNKLRSELNAAYWHFRVVEYIRELRGDYLRELNQTPSFWGLTIKAHVVSALTLLNRFFDKKEKVKHLHMQNFLDFIEQNKDIFSRRSFKKRLLLLGRYDDLAAQFNSEITTDKIEQDRQRLRDLPISSLRAWRQKTLSHIDKDYVVQGIDVATKHPIRVAHLREIIDTLDTMLNEYLLAYDFSTYSKDLSIERGIKYILDTIRSQRRS